MHKENRPCRVVILISGRGTNLKALIEAQKQQNSSIEIVKVISNRPLAEGIDIAEKANIPTAIIDHTQYSDRESFDKSLTSLIEQSQPDLIVLAGFMRILTSEFVTYFEGKMLNIHPSLLPKYQGLHTHRRALEANDEMHGATVHYVTPQLDGGPAIIQAIVSIDKTDDETSLALKVQEQEHIVYPMAVKWFAEGRLVKTNNQILLDGEPLPPNGYQMDTRRSYKKSNNKATIKKVH